MLVHLSESHPDVQLKPPKIQSLLNFDLNQFAGGLQREESPCGNTISTNKKQFQEKCQTNIGDYATVTMPPTSM
jgi:hypothetical protein